LFKEVLFYIPSLVNDNLKATGVTILTLNSSSVEISVCWIYSCQAYSSL